ncbi:GNAT family N-acetyltransferase [Arthrobacter sp. MYb227]|uniref:GNAT family N-acetyltransferase n=1 Tax=Arthrobacter sp. MYb227 TaxID=1848601 RepID=UPI000CFA8ED1|nr:GNAT family N-acetyltransferase [Arthrobacter sp. MYb227]PQZ95746.1 GNAT family N-acetyltransferase [Arthrobacter sp. MYb227]
MRSGHLRIDNVPLTRGEDGTPSDAYAAWLNSVGEGFYGKPSTGERLEQMFQSHQIDARVLTAVYDDSRDTKLVDSLVPVATYASFTKTLNVGDGLLPAHLVTTVTVRPTHRRRGILRKLMSDDLAKAKSAGFAVAALTATEATIYGRFGFGRCTEAQRMNLDVRGEVRFHAVPVGSVVQVVPSKLSDIAAEVFERFHTTQRGSVGRQEAYQRHATGAWGPDGQEPDPKTRAAVYLDDAGVIQGFVTYAFTGWEPAPITLEIRDLVAATPIARRELFRFMTAHDLIERVSYPAAAANDPLGWALEDPARLSYLEREHGLWVRVLDVQAAFAARKYTGSGFFTLRVADVQGLTSGSYAFEITEGTPEITRIEDSSKASIACDVQVLGPLLLGTAPIADLLAAGIVTLDDPSDLGRLAALVDLPGIPHAINGF